MPEALKDMFFNRAFFDGLGQALDQVMPGFNRGDFEALIFDSVWDERSLMQRMRHTAAVLGQVLPADYRTALGLLRQVIRHLPQHNFDSLIFPEFVALHGQQDWESSLPALETFTQVMSAEFAVRPFIMQDTPRMVAQMLDWAAHPHEAVRRLASEGSRPRLPWGMALAAFKRDPSPTLPILERLKDDPSETVRRSVANHLNDIAKDNPQVVIDLLRRWQDDASPERQWIVKHALRTLIKAGHSEALALLGFEGGAPVDVCAFTLSVPQVRLGEAIRFTAEIEAREDGRLVIDYVVHYRKANGSLAPKVFKLTTAELKAGERIRVSKSISFRPLTTRVYYCGDHAVALKINGVEFAGPHFLLVE